MREFQGRTWTHPEFKNSVCVPEVLNPHSKKSVYTVMQDITHLLNRIGFGARPGQIQQVQQMGVDQYIHQQLRPERSLPDEISIPTVLGPPAQVLASLQAHKLVRAVHNEEQLQEVMTDFWFNHFNIFWRKNADRWLTTPYEMHAIRPHVLGKFRDLLTATAKSPAMLVYLDNRLSSSIRGINENYARELMELHTLGVNGGYTQKDVQEVARAFTGWTTQGPKRGGEFIFRPRLHDDGEKDVLGHKITAGGMRDGEMVIEILAKHPSTARFISTKLVRRFVADSPPDSLVKHVAETYRRSDGDIREMMYEIVTSKEFNAPDAVGAKTKTPFEYAVSAIRCLDGRTDGGRPLAQSIARMGQPLYQCQPPTGYPDRGDHWLSSGGVLERLNFVVALAEGRIEGTSVSIDEPLKFVVKRLGSPDFQKR